MKIFQVNSIPLKDVIISLAESFKVKHQHRCGEYFLSIPTHIGEGEIRGINFENGLGLIIYKATFKEDIRLEFTLDEVHPVKFLYSLNGSVRHEFANERKRNSMKSFDVQLSQVKEKAVTLSSLKKIFVTKLLVSKLTEACLA